MKEALEEVLDGRKGVEGRGGFWREKDVKFPPDGNKLEVEGPNNGEELIGVKLGMEILL